MSVTREEVEGIADLARLELGEEEAESLRRDLNGILEHMETLGQAGRPEPNSAGADEERDEPEARGDEVETRESTVAGTDAAHRSGAAPFREDGGASPDRLNRRPEEIAPRWEDGFFSVPRLPGLDEGGTP